MFDPVGSTSWHNRHLTVFQNLDQILRAGCAANPTIMIIGPGGVTRVAAWLLNDAARPEAPRIRKLLGDAARYGDQVLRRFPLMPLASLEPVELERTLTMPHRLVVVDRSARIIRAVQRQLPAATCYCHDVSLGPPPNTADVVIAMNVVCRLPEPRAGMVHVAGAVKPNGWLVMDDRSAESNLGGGFGFERVGPKTYRRKNSSGDRA